MHVASHTHVVHSRYTPDRETCFVVRHSSKKERDAHVVRLFAALINQHAARTDLLLDVGLVNHRRRIGGGGDYRDEDGNDDGESKGDDDSGGRRRERRWI